MRQILPAKTLDMTWPYLATPTRNPLRAEAAKRLFLNSVRELPLTVRLPTGEVFGQGRGDFASGGDPTMRVHDPQQFFARLGRHGTLGFGESYLLGAWDIGDGSRLDIHSSDEMVAWLAVYVSALEAMESRPLYFLRQLWRRFLPIAERNSADGAVRNVQAHYDLHPRLFELFLDPTMTYSSAWFEPGDDLLTAQIRKTDAILDLADVGPDVSLLDVGSGFGALAMRAATERGARVTGITLSQKQLDFATESAQRNGVGDRTRFLLEDYRHHGGNYHSVASVEMIEAVGSDYWADYFAAVDRLLEPDGHFALQVSVLPHGRMIASRDNYSWVDRYIFPGGQFLSLREICRVVGGTSLEIVQARKLTDSYERTLRAWRHRFLSARDDVRELGFDDTFVRLWTLYLAYFEAGFRTRYCDVWQLGMRKVVRAPRSV
jgi:cyclopropane-fatty-acyl-phospholipid synthase